MKKEIYALGVGHNTPVFMELAEAANYSVVGLYHYNSTRTGQIDHGKEIIGSFDDLLKIDNLKGYCFLLTMGDPIIREELTRKILYRGGEVPSIIHPTCVISRFAKVSNVGVYIGAFTHVQADTTIGEGTVILSGVNISHTNNIGRYCFMAGGVTIGAYTTIEDYVFVGQGSLTISGRVDRIGAYAFIAAGALVTHSVASNTRVMGRPAKVIC